MRKILGSVVVQETGRAVSALTVTAFARGDRGRSRIGSVTTEADGRFSIEYAEKTDGTVWNLEVEVTVDSVPPRALYADSKPREDAGAIETWSIRLPLAELAAAGVLGKHDGAANAIRRR